MITPADCHVVSIMEEKTSQRCTSTVLVNIMELLLTPFPCFRGQDGIAISTTLSSLHSRTPFTALVFSQLLEVPYYL